MTNALLLRRRGMMAAAGGGDWYVTNGLVLHMDGINQGNTANIWKDLVSGHVFEPVGNVAFNSDNVQFGYDGNSYLVNTSESYITNPLQNIGTIEVCAEKLGTLYDIFIPNSNNKSICFIERSSGILWRYASGSATPRLLPTLSKASYSVSAAFKLENGVAMTEGSASYVSGTTNAACIGRSNNSYFKGKIYNIRIYNRHLTEDEIMHNLAIDNSRFNLGLNL